jgi:hypothetical protein
MSSAKTATLGDVVPKPESTPGVLNSFFAALLRGFRSDPDYYWKDLLHYDLPDTTTPQQVSLLAEISVLDNRSCYTFGPNTRARSEVKQLLCNSWFSDLPCGNRHFLDSAIKCFHRHLLSRNRWRYVGGVLLGIAVLVMLAWSVRAWADTGEIEELGLQAACCMWIILFAGMGTLCSVFSRLASIDLSEETSGGMILLSGIFRPVTATMFALAIIEIIKLKVITIQIGAEARQQDIYFLAAFLSGFSERFATDLIARTETVFRTPDPQAARPASPT